MQHSNSIDHELIMNKCKAQQNNAHTMEQQHDKNKYGYNDQMS